MQINLFLSHKIDCGCMKMVFEADTVFQSKIYRVETLIHCVYLVYQQYALISDRSLSARKKDFKKLIDLHLIEMKGQGSFLCKELEMRGVS